MPREYPTLQRIRDEVGWDPFDGEPADFEVLERYISALESQVRAGDMLAGQCEEVVSRAA
jgi:hypothetical protein